MMKTVAAIHEHAVAARDVIWRGRFGPVATGIAALLLSLATGHGARAEPAAKPEAAACNAAAFRPLVDVGHTAGKPGAKSARGADEYDFNLRLARLIHQKLTDAGFSKAVLLITTEAPRLGLFKRVARANTLSADLFLSVHHDSVPDRFAEKWEYEGVKREFSDRFRGHSLFVSRDNGDYKGSLLFGHLLGSELKTRGLKYTPHYVEKFMGSRQRQLVDAEVGVYRYDQLVVLKDSRMPAVLMEAGSIINRDEELLLGTPEHQALIADAAVEAIKSFCAARAAPARTAAGPPSASPAKRR